MADPLTGRREGVLVDESVLDNPVWFALTGPHAAFGDRNGQAVRYDSAIGPFHAVAPDPDGNVWDDIAGLAAPGTVLPLGGRPNPPPGWPVVDRAAGVQLVGRDVAGAPCGDAVALGKPDGPDMLALADRTRPGPFGPRTVELGGYLGIRRDGRLVAMAGRRWHPPGWTEISAVCTAPEFRGQGLATRLVLAVAAGIRARGETPFLHTAAGNTAAIRLYESLGFRVRERPPFTWVRVPG